jgi:hypothetical protein
VNKTFGSEYKDTMKPPHLGEVITIGERPEPCGLWILGVVQDSGVHGDGRIWARIWYVDITTCLEGIVEWRGSHWEFCDRAWRTLDRACKSTIESEIALYRKFHPKA